MHFPMEESEKWVMSASWHVTSRQIKAELSSPGIPNSCRGILPFKTSNLVKASIQLQILFVLVVLGGHPE